MQHLDDKLFYKGVNETLENYEKTNKFNDAQLAEIRYGLEAGLDVSMYDKPEFDNLQMREIRYGLIEALDVTVYANPKIKHKQMRDILLTLKKATGHL